MFIYWPYWSNTWLFLTIWALIFPKYYERTVEVTKSIKWYFYELYFDVYNYKTEKWYFKKYLYPPILLVSLNIPVHHPFKKQWCLGLDTLESKCVTLLKWMQKYNINTKMYHIALKSFLKVDANIYAIQYIKENNTPTRIKINLLANLKKKQYVFFSRTVQSSIVDSIFGYSFFQKMIRHAKEFSKNVK